MAFQQPTRQLQQRVSRVESEDGDSAILTHHTRPEQNESQTWVLFTPGTDAGTTTSYLSSVQGDQLTPGRSRISDLGSLDTAARSDFNSQPDNSAVPTDVLEPEDDLELDSLDSHLSEFRTAPYHYAQQQGHTAPVFPGHDGLGSFRLDGPGTNMEAQNRLYAFEQYNPNRVKRRRESFDLARLELESEEAQEIERNRRVEAWRLEQSQLLLEDIRKETRRRRQSEASLQKARSVAEGPTTKGSTDEVVGESNISESDWHEQDSDETEGMGRGLWSNLTRKVIRDVVGIDDRLLAILFGEALPDDESMSSTPKASQMHSSNPAFANLELESLGDSAWQLRMLERIAKELGHFIHRISAHPGAFSAYSRVQQMPLPYAGLPVIPEATLDNTEPSQKVDDSIFSMPQFQPTVSQPVDIRGARPTGPAPTMPSVTETATSEAPPTFTQQEWEQDLDIKLVFRYLRSRFTPSRPTSPPFSSGTSHLATSSTQDLAAKAARVRQHHPLISHSHTHHRPRPVERRTFKVTAPSSPVALRAAGSCASQSTRRSRRRDSVSSRHSSRHYWDIGGSVGTGSIIVSTGPGPMGSWGEV
ncbi:hypothetical protein OQA88_13550 [Cercophora sp. LCS_1]